MIFYKYLVNCAGLELEKEMQNKEDREKLYSRNSPIEEWNRDFCASYKMDKKSYLVISDLLREKMTIVAAHQADASSRTCDSLLLKILPDVRILKREEITGEEFERELIRAEKNEWMNNSAGYTLKKMRLNIQPECYSFFEPAPYQVSERIYTTDGVTRETIGKQMEKILASQNFYEEIDRIFSNENEKRFAGHPVHYLISAGDKAAADDMLEVLIPSLLKNERLLSSRVYDVQKITDKAGRDENFANVFEAAQGGTVVLNLEGEKNIGQYATGYYKLAEKLGEKLSEYGNKVLFVFVDISGNRSVSDETMAMILAHADMIQIQEGHGNLEQATGYLKQLAEKTDYKGYTMEDLVRYLPKEKELYSVSDIFQAYNRWYGSGLKTHVYRAYKEKDLVKIELKKKMDKPYEELQKMVGLTDVKKVVDEILATAKMQKMRKSMGLPKLQTSMHMLFSGNPGTAKTTVARLLAQVLKEEEVLKNGHIVECGRQDLVGKYVGWTAQIVEDKFLSARGGILFIDEAYSLVEDGRTYGAEAINTIVQQMENYRDEVIVIFAGYPEKMREFLQQNEGLASRIAFHLNFPDYSADELTQILDLMLEKSAYRMTAETRNKCLEICENACQEPNFGNGRYVRNLLDHAVMRQAERLFRENRCGELSKEEACMLQAEDFEPIGMEKKESRKIGF